MARLNEIAHTPYYGTVDATPLWLILLSETFRWTADRQLVDELWEPAMRALDWIDHYGDMDGDGYVEYRCNGPEDLINHGWKDSSPAVFYTDGTLAEQPIALVEIQGYVYAAKCGMAELCDMRGDVEGANRLRAEAEALRERFNRDYWVEERDFFAFALDGSKRQVTTVTSNPGHALWSQIVDPSLARRMVPHFRRSDLLSGWGIRCVSESEAGYNPMGYHEGTVWPHDVSLLVAGLRRYGFDRDAQTIATQLYHAGQNYLYFRFPEVFSGLSRTHNPFPVPYPVACSPQAWAAGTTLLLLQMFLGIFPDAGHGRVTLAPALPSWLSEVRVSNLRIGAATLDLRFMAHGEYSTAQVLSKSGSLDVMI
jgi:glycogen debranching enzyme